MKLEIEDLEPLRPEIQERINRALDAVQQGWQEVDAYQLEDTVVSSRALHVAVEALRKHLHDPRCWRS